MKNIIKGLEPQDFTEWKGLANDDWQPTYDNLDTPVKNSVKAALMQEQGYICCYCERRLTTGDSHIEHFIPQHDENVDALDFSNMLCSCQQRLEKGDPRHCGNSKGEWYDELLLISPFSVGCESRFSFTADGKIQPADPTDEGAKESIRHLNLDLPKLNRMRENALEPFLDTNLTDEEFTIFVAGYLRRCPHQGYSVFWTTIDKLFSV
ncbi:TIGR02646 family protein [Serratia plymuthica]|uniref:retron system putative HNH endonuclease n=1 Tax=Serratia plymuthica TaxID=82996 RepID=UPI001F537798|nr:retron system putative HNH endonuclease [Serratia plymuthica]UNK26826.1 TIGR02646 family protein [Serratia plymuthica]